MVKAYSNLRRTLVGFLIIILSITTYAQGDADSTDDFPHYGNIVIPVSVSVRSAASIESNIIGELRRGDFIQALNINATQQWVFIKRNGLVGWVKRDLVRWHDEIDNLPVRPSFAPLPTIAPEVLSATPFIPTATQSASYVRLEYLTSAVVRSGPSRTYPIIDVFPPNYSIEYPIGRDENTQWVLLQYTDETTNEKKFGWISVILVEWLIDLDTLPIVSGDNLTPTVTFTPSKTHTVTPTPSITPSPTSTQTPSQTPSPSSTPSQTPSPSSTPSQTPSPSSTPSQTPSPSSTPSQTPSPSNTPSQTPSPSSTPSQTPSPSSTPSQTPSPSNTPSQTPSPSSTPSQTPSPSNTPSQTATNVVQAADINAPTPTQLDSEDIPEGIPPTTDETVNLPVETIVAGIISAVVLLYVALYWNGIASVERYKDGFVIKDCPACNNGQLQVETKQYRIFGIPRGKHTVRCDNCRSILRATGKQRWRYAVDRMENPDLYERYNNKHIMTSEIARLLTQKRSKSTHITLPKFVDDSDDKS